MWYNDPTLQGSIHYTNSSGDTGVFGWEEQFPLPITVNTITDGSSSYSGSTSNTDASKPVASAVTPAPSPKTGDSTGIILWCGLMICSVLGLIIIYIYGAKHFPKNSGGFPS